MMDNKEPESYIQIIFKETNSVEFMPNIHGVSPIQVLAIAEYLKLIGQSMFYNEFRQQEADAQRNKIVVPGNKNLDGIMK
jgi:hypothetical protein